MSSIVITGVETVMHCAPFVTSPALHYKALLYRYNSIGFMFSSYGQWMLVAKTHKGKKKDRQSFSRTAWDTTV